MTTPKKEPKLKQAEIPGTTPKRNAKIDALAEEYQEIKEKRMALTTKEVEAKAKLVAAMDEAKLKAYKNDDLTVSVEEKENVKVKRVEDKTDNIGK